MIDNTWIGNCFQAISLNQFPCGVVLSSCHSDLLGVLAEDIDVSFLSCVGMLKYFALKHICR